MEQGIVMEIKNKHAIVLTKEGAFKRVSLKKGQHVEIGSEIDVPTAKPFIVSRAQRVAMSIAAVAAILLLVFTQLPVLKQSNLAVAAYVSLDINPSLEVGVSETLNVVEVIPINEDGKKIVEQMQDSYRGKSLEEFVDYTIELAEEDGYLTENKDVLLTTTTVNKMAEGKIEKNLNEIKKEIEHDGVAVTTLKGDENSRKEAKDLGVSPGKYLIYKDSKESLTIEETKNLSVTQIYEKLEEKKNEKTKEENKNKGNKEQQKTNDKSNKIEKDLEKTNKTPKNEDKKKNTQEIKSTEVNNTNKKNSKNEPPAAKGNNQGEIKKQKKSVDTNKKDKNNQGSKEKNKVKQEEKNKEHGNNNNKQNEKNNGNKKDN